MITLTPDTVLLGRRLVLTDTDTGLPVANVVSVNIEGTGTYSVRLGDGTIEERTGNIAISQVIPSNTVNSPAVDIKDILVGAGIGVFGTSLFVGREPVAPDTCVTVYDAGGQDPLPSDLTDFPAIQVRVRGLINDYEGAMTKAQAVKDALLGLPETTVGTTRYVGITMRGEINFMGYDEANRPSFTLNFQVTREPSAGTNRI